ncbi:hypothetical protein [Roseibium alexandrii]|uniref:Uncharacterized protein n=1 Tax=Roseibium alexandrii (strain DSM 17067 / NCIMB 14079 / DFL-11) TaxID=244592 RepID=A0A5E8H3X0_ROSAD|nr:hypothetical protein [Roseibium alexandrii]EEE47259.2 hypothetical protein SADFL11_4548 [Roseibium alexandrii DFL-11]
MQTWAGLTRLLVFVSISLFGFAAWGLTLLEPDRQSYLETFDTTELETVLEWQIMSPGRHSPWSISVDGANLVWRNTSKKTNSQHQSIDWVRFEDNKEITRLNEASLSVTVLPRRFNSGGAGIVAGTYRQRQNWRFNIDNDGGYHVLMQSGRGFARVYKGEHPAIKPNTPNVIVFERQGEEFVFFVNEQEVIRLPTNARRSDPHWVGLTAFGIGTYKFAEMTITQ